MSGKKGCITEERRKAILDRLNRINGQINGVQKMVQEGRYCIDILQQISSIHQALRGVDKVLMRNYLEICATDAIRSKRKEREAQIYDELMDVIYTFSK